MRQFANYGDQRSTESCIHCGGADETRDHVPSRVLLDEPYPENLGTSPSCTLCNNSLSVDEEYLACLLECVLAGDVDPSRVSRPKVAQILRCSSRLQDQLRRQRREADGRITWDPDTERVKRVLLKLARGHAAFELNEPQTGEPHTFWISPLPSLTVDQREMFEAGWNGGFEPYPEVGSRYHQRLWEGGDFGPNGWIIIQPGLYRFRLSLADGLRVRMTLREYLACEIGWN